MDQNKHAMLYPSLAGRPDQQSTSFQANGMSYESPPSYDFAVASPMPQPTAPGYPMPSRSYLPPPPPSMTAQPIHQHLTAESVVNSIAVRSPQPRPPVIVEQPVRSPVKLGPQPSTVTCPDCGERTKSKMHHTANRRTHIFAVVLCLVGWCCCACCVPYCMNSCKTGHHYCAKCNRFLGTHQRNEP